MSRKDELRSISPNRVVILIAHRGKGPTSKFTGDSEAGLPPGLPPENSIAAFKAGIDEGADGIEMDIFLSKDGVPMVIHDDELNRNVAGAKRAAKKLGDEGYLGKVSEYTAKELKAFDLGNGNRIPTLEEVIDLVYKENKSLRALGKANLILNIEFKDKTSGNVERTVEVITKAITERKISSNDVIFCSFDHSALERTAEISYRVQVAPALKTAFLFGEDKVDIANGWTVPPGTPYRPEAIDELEKIVERIDSRGQQPSVVAADAVLWDINEELVQFAERKGLGLHASTSDFRSFNNIAFIANLAEIRKRVPIFFKTDEPAKIANILERAYAAEKVSLSKLRLDEIVSKKESKSTIGINLSNVVMNFAETAKGIRRLAKPGQAVPKEHTKHVLEGVGEPLREFVRNTEERARSYHEPRITASLAARRNKDDTAIKEIMGMQNSSTRSDATEPKKFIRNVLSREKPAFLTTYDLMSRGITEEQRLEARREAYKAFIENQRKGRSSSFSL